MITTISTRFLSAGELDNWKLLKNIAIQNITNLTNANSMHKTVTIWLFYFCFSWAHSCIRLAPTLITKGQELHQTKVQPTTNRGAKDKHWSESSYPAVFAKVVYIER